MTQPSDSSKQPTPSSNESSSVQGGASSSSAYAGAGGRDSLSKLDDMGAPDPGSDIESSFGRWPDAVTPVREGDPESIGRFPILGRVGQGAMGVVYSAYDERLDRKIAIKLLAAGRELYGTGGYSRLLREAKAMAQISHPNVVQVYEAGIVDDKVFVAMEFLRGPTLRQWQAETFRSWREQLAVHLQAARGLQAAHEVGVVHRDYKPENVIVALDGRVRVLDFGLACAALDADVSRVGSLLATGDPRLETLGMPGMAAEGADENMVTETTTILGTPAYMSPEQHRGGAIDARSDQYSFCIALYEGVYRERPFAGTTRRALAKEVSSGHVRPRPDSSDVPHWLRKVLLKGLAADPAKRFPTMRALIEDIEKRLQPRRRPLAAISISAVVALGAGYMLAQSSPSPEDCQRGVERGTSVWNPERKSSLRQRFARLGPSHATSRWNAVIVRLDDWIASWSEERRELCQNAPRFPFGDVERKRARLARTKSCLDGQLTGFQDVLQIVEAAPTVLVAEKTLEQLERPPHCARDANKVETITEEPRVPLSAEVQRRISELERELRSLENGRPGDEMSASMVAEASRRIETDALALGRTDLAARSIYARAVFSWRMGDTGTAKRDLKDAYYMALRARLHRVAAESASVRAMLADRSGEDADVVDGLLEDARANLVGLGSDSVSHALVAFASGDIHERRYLAGAAPAVVDAAEENAAGLGADDARVQGGFRGSKSRELAIAASEFEAAGKAYFQSRKPALAVEAWKRHVRVRMHQLRFEDALSMMQYGMTVEAASLGGRADSLLQMVDLLEAVGRESRALDEVTRALEDSSTALPNLELIDALELRALRLRCMAMFRTAADDASSTDDGASPSRPEVVVVAGEGGVDEQGPLRALDLLESRIQPSESGDSASVMEGSDELKAAPVELPPAPTSTASGKSKSRWGTAHRSHAGLQPLDTRELLRMSRAHCLMAKAEYDAVDALLDQWLPGLEDGPLIGSSAGSNAGDDGEHEVQQRPLWHAEMAWLMGKAHAGRERWVPARKAFVVGVEIVDRLVAREDATVPYAHRLRAELQFALAQLWHPDPHKPTSFREDARQSAFAALRGFELAGGGPRYREVRAWLDARSP